MGAQVEDVVAALEQVLSPVAVVDIEVEDRDPLETVGPQQALGGEGDVVEEAEAHRGGPLRMMAGRADGREGRPGGRRSDPVGSSEDHVDSGQGGAKDGFELGPGLGTCSKDRASVVSRSSGRLASAATSYRTDSSRVRSATRCSSSSAWRST